MADPVKYGGHHSKGSIITTTQTKETGVEQKIVNDRFDILFNLCHSKL